MLASAYQTLLHTTLRTWSSQSKTRLDALEFVSFIQSTLNELPSSSSVSTERPRHLVLFGELLVDLIWSLDGDLDEVIADAKAASSNHAGEDPNERDGRDSAVKAEAARKVAETDKETLAELLKMLLVRVLSQCSNHLAIRCLTVSFQRSGIIDAHTCRERLDTSLLTLAGLIPDKVIFEKKEIRTRTGLLYVGFVLVAI